MVMVVVIVFFSTAFITILVFLLFSASITIITLISVTISFAAIVTKTTPVRRPFGGKSSLSGNL